MALLPVNGLSVITFLLAQLNVILPKPFSMNGSYDYVI